MNSTVTEVLQRGPPEDGQNRQLPRYNGGHPQLQGKDRANPEGDHQGNV